MNFSRNGLFLVILTLLFISIYSLFKVEGRAPTEIPYSEFVDLVEQGKVSEVIREGQGIRGIRKNSAEKFTTTVWGEGDELMPLLRKHSVKVVAKDASEQPWYYLVLVQLIPIVLIVGIWIFVLRQVQAGAGKGMSFGKARPKLLTENQQKVTFADVAGIDEARSELEEIIQFLKDPKKFTRLGGRIPKGVLLVGSPGTGKTLLARAIAGEAGVPFFSISGSDFVEMFVGVGASRVRDLFIQGKKNAPCLIFIDEIDAVGRQRGTGMGGGHDEREQTLNQLLVEMDGFESNEGVILIAATNRPDVLDPALLRPGRFDRRVVVPRPDAKGRLGILKVHSKRVPMSANVNLETVARGTPGFSGADLEILVNEAALWAARKGQDKVTREDFEYAKDKVMMGAERRSMLLSDKEKRVTAFHEAGHALVAKLLPHADPVHKLTIVPRGMALGLMQQLPEGDRHTYTKNYWMAQLAVCFGGRAAEAVVYNEITTGAMSDIQQATSIARRMVCEWGMSEKLGPVNYGTSQEHVFLGREIGKPREHSDEMQVRIDNEVKEIIDERYNFALRLVRENNDALTRLANAVFDRETIDSEEITLLMENKPLPEKKPLDGGGTGSSPVATDEAIPHGARPVTVIA